MALHPASEVERPVGTAEAEDVAAGPLFEVESTPQNPAAEARTISPKDVQRQVVRDRGLSWLSAAMKEAELARPKVRAHCEDGPRPCPFISCRWNLAIEVAPTGGIKVNFPGRDLGQMPQTCALDVADRGGATLEEVGEILNVTRERVRQIEAIAARKVRLRTPRE